MDETKEILTNEDVVEAVEGVVEAIPDTNENNLAKGLAIGTLVTVVGAVVTKYIIVPGAKKISNLIKERKAEKTADDGEIVIDDFDVD